MKPRIRRREDARRKGESEVSIFERWNVFREEVGEILNLSVRG